MEANIVMLSSQQLDEVILQDPSGSQVPVDGERLIQSNSDQYTMLKLLSPRPGTGRCCCGEKQDARYM